MPARRKPTSTRQKKADQQLKRAIKRGDVSPPELKKHPHHRKPKIGPSGNSDKAQLVESARKLQSAFIKLPPKYLEDTKLLASTVPLYRPISIEKATFKFFHTEADLQTVALTCPKRPKWKFDMSKLEVERNEEGVFKKWLAQTDQLLEEWQNREKQNPGNITTSAQLRSPSYFERNLEVWRQLWRVTEISQIILLLLDSRCPILHYPPSLAAYLADHKVILVLTKVDISGSTRVEAWTRYIRKTYPNTRVVEVESYTEKEEGANHQGHKQYDPNIPERFRAKLVQAIKEVHSELLEPPHKVKNNPNRLEDWIPTVKRNIDWEGVLNAGRLELGVEGSAIHRPKACEPSNDQESDKRWDSSENQHQEPEDLTIGLIGQPNVGKSSLLNALFGVQKVRASKTPGKTKHFQTLYWTPDVRLVDCPGLVMPNYVPMEMQVLSGILPISRVSAVPSCVYFTAQFLPLERIFNLAHPATKEPLVEDKRTWRDGMRQEDRVQSPDQLDWTAMDILTAYADAKGWVTAKAGRPDIHRAGNSILRAVAESRISWAFWPPNSTLDEVDSVASGEGVGIWILRGDMDDGSEQESESEEGEVDNIDNEDNKHSTGSSEDSELDGDVESDGGGKVASSGIGRFSALAIKEDGDEEDEGSGG